MIRLKNRNECSKIAELPADIKHSVERILTAIEKSHELCNQSITFLFIEDSKDVDVLCREIFDERKASLDFISKVSRKEKLYYCLFVTIAEEVARFIFYVPNDYVRQIEKNLLK